MRMILISMLVLTGCATSARYDPVTPTGNTCASLCMQTARSCQAVAKESVCSSDLDACYGRCLAFHGGDMVHASWTVLVPGQKEHKTPPAGAGGSPWRSGEPTDNVLAKP